MCHATGDELLLAFRTLTVKWVRLVEEDVRLTPPASFPGKLLAFLYERFKAFDAVRKVVS